MISDNDPNQRNVTLNIIRFLVFFKIGLKLFRKKGFYKDSFLPKYEYIMLIISIIYEEVNGIFLSYCITKTVTLIFWSIHFL